jgi:hypothetical protein
MNLGDSESPCTLVLSTATILISHAFTFLLMLDRHAVSLISAFQLLCFSREHRHIAKCASVECYEYSDGL